MSIDSYRFLDFASRQVMKAWAARERPGVIPFTPLAKPLGDCTVALVSTAGIARNDDRPFDQDGERGNPWLGDPRFPEIPLGTTEHHVRLYHLHIDPGLGEADLDVGLPMRGLTELARKGSPVNRRRGITRSWATSSIPPCWQARRHRPSPLECAPTASTPRCSSRHDRSAAG